MNAGITVAAPLQLRVGIALTAEQAAQLTSDIVWLVQQEVTLPDGNKQKVLVPQVYAVARSGDLAANGALLSGNTVNLNTTGDISNAHATIQGRELINLNATNVRNLAGRIKGTRAMFGGMEMSTLTIRLPDDTAQRLKSLAQSRGLSMKKLVEQLSAHALSAWDTENHFRAVVATGNVDKALAVLDRLDAADSSA